MKVELFALTNDSNIDLRSLGFYVVNGLFWLWQGAKEKLLGFFFAQQLRVSLLSRDSTEDFAQLTVLSRTDVSLLLQYEEGVVSLDGYHEEKFTSALQNSLIWFPFLSCSFELVNEGENTYVTARQNKEALSVWVFQSNHASAALVKLLNFFCQPLQTVGRRIIFSSLHKRKFFQKIAFYCAASMQTLYVSVTLGESMQDGAVVRFRMSHTLADGWTQSQFLTYFMQIYESDDVSQAKEIKPYATYHQGAAVHQKCFKIRELLSGGRLNSADNWPDLCKIQHGYNYVRHSLFGSWVYPPGCSHQYFSFRASSLLSEFCQEDMSSAMNLCAIAFVFHRAMRHKQKRLTLLTIHRPFLHTQGNIFIPQYINVNLNTTPHQIFSKLNGYAQLITDLSNGSTPMKCKLDEIFDNNIESSWIAVIPTVANTPKTKLSPLHGRNLPCHASRDEDAFFARMPNWVNLTIANQTITASYDLIKSDRT